MHIRSDVNLWFNKMYVLFIEKDITADVVVKPVVGNLLHFVCTTSRATVPLSVFNTNQRCALLKRVTQIYIKMYSPVTSCCNLFRPF